MQDGSTEQMTGSVTALYHGACPVCSAEISHYQDYCVRKAVAIGWADISNGVDAPLLAELGLDREDVKRRMTVLDSDGRIHRGVDAFLVLWRQMPRYNWLARVVSCPGVYHAATFLYDRLLAPALYAWNRSRGR
ncbi:MAG: DUF393 domain-containing protein [Alphaproteobacteria bacterium]